MENKELCRRVLETLLQMEIELTEYPVREKNIRLSTEGKPIRLDIYVKDKEDTLYDAEMQNKNGKSLETISLPKRSRYYQALMDSESLRKGIDYHFLSDSYIIFICTFDPFGQGKYLYTFENICKEDKKLSLNDRTSKLFFNTKAERSSIPENIRNLFDYIEDRIIRDELTQDLDMEVEKLRKDEGWWAAYMKTVTWEMDARFEGRHEGIEIGRIEGGIETLIHTCHNLGTTKEQAKEQLIQQFALSPQAAEEELCKHWK